MDMSDDSSNDDDFDPAMEKKRPSDDLDSDDGSVSDVEREAVIYSCVKEIKISPRISQISHTLYNRPP